MTACYLARTGKLNGDLKRGKAESVSAVTIIAEARYIHDYLS